MMMIGVQYDGVLMRVRLLKWNWRIVDGLMSHYGCCALGILLPARKNAAAAAAAANSTDDL